MGCKHEGGTAPCVRDPHRNCKAQIKVYAKRYREKHVESNRAYSVAWRAANRCEHERVRNTCGLCEPVKVIAKYKNRAQARGYSWEITDSQAVWLMQQKCAYCEQEVAGGIDRAKNEYGYTVLNSVPCCASCNYRKHTLSIKAFIVSVNQIARYCPDYPKFKRRWESIRKKLTRLGEKQCLCSSTSVPSATQPRKDSRRSQSPSTRNGARVGGNSKLPPVPLLGSGPGNLESRAAL
jgi:hypothetical protein